MISSTVRLGDLGRVVTGRTPPAAHPEYWGDDVPFLTPSDMDGSRTVQHFERRLSGVGAAAMRNAIVPYGVGVSCIGWQMGKTVYIPSPALTNQQINTIVFDPATVDGLFLYYVMSSRREEIFRLGSGGSRTPILNKSFFEALTLELPPLSVQRAITSFLGAIDDKIELNRRMNRTLAELASALFKSWFVDFDPVRAKRDDCKPLGVPVAAASLFPAHFEDSKLGPIPKGWRTSKIGDEVRIVGGSTPRTREPRFWNGDICWVTPRDLSRLSDPVVLGSERYITQEGLGQISSGLLPRGTVLLSSRAPIGYLAIADVPVAVNQGFVAAVCEDRLSNHWVLNWIEQNMDEILSRAGGTTFAEISKANFRPIPVVVPSREVIEAFEAVATPLYERLIANVKENATLEQLRDALSPALFSGEVTISQVEKAVAGVA